MTPKYAEPAKHVQALRVDGRPRGVWLAQALLLGTILTVYLVVTVYALRGAVHHLFVSTTALIATGVVVALGQGVGWLSNPRAPWVHRHARGVSLAPLFIVAIVGVSAILEVSLVVAHGAGVGPAWLPGPSDAALSMMSFLVAATIGFGARSLTPLPKDKRDPFVPIPHALTIAGALENMRESAASEPPEDRRVTLLIER